MAGEYRWHLMNEKITTAIRELKTRLGGCCVSCQETRLDLLEFHHHQGKNWRSNSLSRWQRIKRYEAEAAEGLIDLMCKPCHDDPTRHLDTCFCPFCRERVTF